MKQIKNIYKLKDNIDFCDIKKFGYEYKGNWATGDIWIKQVEDKTIRAIIITKNRKIGFAFPYMDIKYPPIENYISDLIKNGFTEKITSSATVGRVIKGR